MLACKLPKTITYREALKFELLSGPSCVRILYGAEGLQNSQLLLKGKNYIIYKRLQRDNLKVLS